MKQTNFLKSFFLLFALIVGSSSVWGADELFYTLTATAKTGTGSNNSYSGNCDIEVGDYTWNVEGNSTLTPWRIGGKSITKTDRAVYSKTAMSSAVTKVELTVGAASSITVNSLKLIVASDANFSSVIDEVTKSFTANSTITFTPTSPATNWASGAYYKFVFNVTVSESSNKFVEFKEAKFYRAEAIAYEITAQSNNNSYGTVSLDGSTITASPNLGYRYADPAYTVSPANSATVSQNGNLFTVTPSANTTVTINFEAIPTYTVTFNAEGGTCGTTSATETIGGAGVTLPTATTGVAGWEFAGWAADAVTNTTTLPTLYKAGSTYYPTSATTLHAVYTLSETGYAYTRVTSLNQINASKKIAVTSQYGTKILTHDASIVNAPTETNNEITVASDQMFVLSGDNTTGYVLTGASGTLSQETLSTSGENDKSIDWSGTNNKWIIELNTYDDNLFALRNAASDKAALEQYSGWKTEYHNDYSSRQYTAMKLYIPKTAYNSNPSAIITPAVAFESADPVTLYLDGTKTDTNTASVTGVDKSVTGYRSSDEDVATVAADGTVTAVGIGTATITAYLDAELGVHKAAEASYEVTVKSATTLAGIKAQATSSTAVDFTADLASDLVITYVSGAHAYLQSGDVAVYASCATGDWEAGKKFTGTISGKVRKYYSEYQITAIDQTPVAGGVVPDAIEVAITGLTTANYATYEGRKIAINGATVNTAMTTSQNSGGKITTDGTNTLNIYAREKGITLTKDEKGNFVGYIGRYNDGIRYYMYEQSQFTKTHNVPQNQVMSFTNSSYNLDEETDAVTGFAGQEVTKTTVKGAVTYSIKDGSDDIITSLNPSTGAVVLNGDCGTATIVATAAAYDEYDEGTGCYTPYKELAKEYSVTVRPRYTVTFSANGQETEVRQESYGAPVTIPTIAPVGNYEVQGWLDEEIDTPTDTEPVELIVESTYTPTNDITLYAVYAKQTIVPNVEQTSTFTFKKSSGSSPTVDNEGTWTFDAVTFVNSNNCGLNSQSITVTPSANVTSIKEVTVRKTANTWGKNVTLTMTDASSNQIFQVKTGDFTSNLYTSDLTDHQSSSYTFASSGMAYVENIVLTYLAPALAYADYRTSLTNATVTMTIGPAGFNTWHQPFAAKFIADGDNGKAYYAADVDANQVVNFQQFSENKIPANTGAIIKGEVNAEVSYIILDADVDFSAENLLHGTNTTETITADDDYYYFISGRTKVSEDPLTYEYGFFVPKSLETGSTFTNNANKAYLQVLKTMFGGATSKGLGMSWTDAETNGITNVNSTYTDGHYYNLAGQRVSEDYKGVVIYNGKKIIKK